jgi:hypothetical protein
MKTKKQDVESQEKRFLARIKARQKNELIDIKEHNRKLIEWGIKV